jgi:hypothetical protein
MTFIDGAASFISLNCKLGGVDEHGLIEDGMVRGGAARIVVQLLNLPFFLFKRRRSCVQSLRKTSTLGDHGI